MMPILYAIIISLLSINVILGLPKAVDLAQTKIFAINVPQNPVFSIGEANAQVAGIEKIAIPKNQGITAPIVTATSVFVEDLDSQTVVLEKESHKRVPIASTTKIMTALVASAYFKPNSVLTVPASALVEGSNMGLKNGEELTFRSLLYGLLLNSGNDAAFTVAANYPGGISAFVMAMNQKASEMNLLDTHFDNPAGFDSPNHYSSASDLAKIAILASLEPQLARVVSTKETSVASIDKVIIHPLKNLNKLLNLPGVLGMKTGYTPQAKENLVGLVERNGHKILTVVLGSEDRFGETQKIFDWVYTNFLWE